MAKKALTKSKHNKDDFNQFDKFLTLVDMGADEYRITEYVNKYEFNKSSIYLTILQFLLDYMKI